MIRGVLVHRDWAPYLGLQFGPERLADQHLRSTREVVERVLAIDPAPLTDARPQPDHMVGVCRHFATLHVSLLRHAGIPARARVGFARYFEPGWVDHWITEWWDGTRWVRTDAQVGSLAAKTLELTFDPADQPPGEFLTAGEAWLRCRAGDEDPAAFGIWDLRGLWFVSGNVKLDLAALNKVELLPWDLWGAFGGGPGWEPTQADLAPVDEVGAPARGRRPRCTARTIRGAGSRGSVEDRQPRRRNTRTRRPRSRVGGERLETVENLVGPGDVGARASSRRERVGDVDLQAHERTAEGLAEVVGAQRSRAATAERAVHHEVERPHVRGFVAIDTALHHGAEVFLYSRRGHFAHDHGVRLVVVGENRDVGDVALVAGAVAAQFTQRQTGH